MGWIACPTFLNLDALGYPKCFFHSIDCGCGAYNVSELMNAIADCGFNEFHISYDVNYKIHRNSPRGEMRSNKSDDKITSVRMPMRLLTVVTTTQYHALTTFDLLSTMGGLMGLMIGASVVTMVEFLEFF